MSTTNTLAAALPQQQTSNPFGQLAQASNAVADVEQARAITETQGAMLMAQRFPRNPIQAMDRILNACTRKTLAEGALYTYARGGTDITGPSIRLAETLAQNWGNIQFGIRELEQRGMESTVEAFAWDVETNTRQTKIFQVKHERHTRAGVKKLTDPRDVYELVANQGARRLRACILGIIPGDVVEAAVNQCEVTNKTNVDITPELIATLVEKFAEYRVSKEQIEKRIQRHLDAITPAQVVSLRKIYNSLKDGMSSTSEWFEITAAEAPRATNEPINPFQKPKATPAPQQKEEPKQKQTTTEQPEFMADTPQKQLAQALSDHGTPEAAFMATIKRTAPKIIGKAKTVNELSDEAANMALNEIDSLLESTEGN